MAKKNTVLWEILAGVGVVGATVDLACKYPKAFTALGDALEEQESVRRHREWMAENELRDQRRACLYDLRQERRYLEDAAADARGRWDFHDERRCLRAIERVNARIDRLL